MGPSRAKRVTIVSFYSPPATGSAHTFVSNLAALFASTSTVTLIGSTPSPTSTITVGPAEVNYKGVAFVTVEQRLRRRFTRTSTKSPVGTSTSTGPSGITKSVSSQTPSRFLSRAKDVIWYSIVPDRQAMWAKSATMALLRQRKNPPDHIVGVFRPSPSLIAAMVGAKIMRVPWTAILMDPWSEMVSSFEPRPAILRRLDRWIDQFVLSKATNVVAVTPNYRKRLLERGLTNVLWCPTVPDLKSLLSAEAIDPEKSSVTNLLYCGSLYGEFRDYRTLIDGLVEANRTEQRFHLTVAGHGLEPLIDYANERGITHAVTSLGTIPWSEAIGRMKGPVINVILLWSGPERYMIPSKLFECLVAGRPILAVGPVDDPVVEHLPTDLSVCAHSAESVADGMRYLAPLGAAEATPRLDFFEVCQREFSQLPQRLGLTT